MSSESEFSIRSMKKVLTNYTSKRVSRDAAEQLGLKLEAFGRARTRKAKVEARKNNRKTIRGSDFKSSRNSPVNTTNTSVPFAQVERIIRSKSVRRVSDSAVNELRKEILSEAEKVSQEVDMLAGHANRSTIQANDLELARSRR